MGQIGHFDPIVTLITKVFLKIVSNVRFAT
jgi:hypothetical protein